jgi:hypothetical protein
MREERCEFRYNRAVECRAYMDRVKKSFVYFYDFCRFQLIQIALFRGKNDDYAMDMFNWWFVEQDMHDKMFNILVPRYRDYPNNEPYTNVYRLPGQTLKTRETKPRPKYRYVEIGVIELRGLLRFCCIFYDY